MSILVSASVLSADMLNLEAEIKKMEDSGVDMLHFDVMDGIFVNNITYGLPVLEAVRKVTDMVLDVHLMITDPIRYVKRFAQAGADIISFHSEAGSPVSETIKAVRECGSKPALAIKPATRAEEVRKYLPELDMVLVMTVEPGFGGQSFIPETIPKIRDIQSMIAEMGLSTHLQVDGGINDVTAGEVRNAGADILVSGSYLFGAESMSEAVIALKEGSLC